VPNNYLLVRSGYTIYYPVSYSTIHVYSVQNFWGSWWHQPVQCTGGRMKVNLRRFEDMKIRLKKSSKMKPLREGISRTDLQISSKIIQEFIFKSSYLQRFPEKQSSHLQSPWRPNIWRFIRRFMSKSSILQTSELCRKKPEVKKVQGFFSLIRSRVFFINSVQGFSN
jgi:hypothetical protein